MQLNEVIKEVGMTKRAVKYYEEKGLLSIKKDKNGYRDYTIEDVEALKKISIYRKLGISVNDIKKLLEGNDQAILIRIYEQKIQEKELRESELAALKDFIDEGNADKANERLRKRYTRLVLHNMKNTNKAVVAVARELACFIWGMMTGNIHTALA